MRKLLLIIPLLCLLFLPKLVNADFTTAWTELTPTNTTYGYLIDDFIRGLRTDVRERLAVDHSFADTDLTTTDTIGYHKYVHLMKQDTDVDSAANVVVVYTKNMDGVPTLYYRPGGAGIVRVVTPNIDTVVGTSDISIADTSYVQMTDMTYTDTFEACNIWVTFNAPIFASVGDTAISLEITIDDVKKTFTTQNLKDLGVATTYLSWVGSVTAASHTIKIKWQVNANEAGQNGATQGERVMTILRHLN